MQPENSGTKPVRKTSGSETTERNGWRLDQEKRVATINLDMNVYPFGGARKQRLWQRVYRSYSFGVMIVGFARDDSDRHGFEPWRVKICVIGESKPHTVYVMPITNAISYTICGAYSSWSQSPNTNIRIMQSTRRFWRSFDRRAYKCSQLHLI